MLGGGSDGVETLGGCPCRAGWAGYARRRVGSPVDGGVARGVRGCTHEGWSTGPASCSNCTYHSLLTTDYSLFTTHYSPVPPAARTAPTTHYLLLTTHYLLLTTHYLPVPPAARTVAAQQGGGRQWAWVPRAAAAPGVGLGVGVAMQQPHVSDHAQASGEVELATGHAAVGQHLLLEARGDN
eukprot:scaffold56473_cov66-Phaeocystis_antarctica.AAC.2